MVAQNHPSTAPRTSVYVDGFNLYNGCLKRSPYRWLDLRSLATSLLPGRNIQTIKYFTAHVKGDPSGASRQNVYLRALQAVGVTTRDNGTFMVHDVIRPISDAPAPGMVAVLEYYDHGAHQWTGVRRPNVGSWLRASVVDREEKGSDVNLASELLWDAFHRRMDAALVISGDSDLETPVRLVSQNLLPVEVVNPTANSPSRELQRAASSYRSLPVGLLAISQLPDPVVTPQGKRLTKPVTW